MNNDLIPISSQVAVSKQDATFLEIRMDSRKYKRLYKYDKPEAVFQIISLRWSNEI